MAEGSPFSPHGMALGCTLCRRRRGSLHRRRLGLGGRIPRGGGGGENRAARARDGARGHLGGWLCADGTRAGRGGGGNGRIAAAWALLASVDYTGLGTVTSEELARDWFPPPGLPRFLAEATTAGTRPACAAGAIAPGRGALGALLRDVFPVFDRGRGQRPAPLRHGAARWGRRMFNNWRPQGSASPRDRAAGKRP